MRPVSVDVPVVPLLSAVILVALTLGGCRGEVDPGADAEAQLEDVVMTTFGPTTTFAARILGDVAPVVCPLPAGADPATWFPTRAVLERYQRARLVVVNGAGFERWVAHVSLAPSRLVDVSAGFADRWLRHETTTHSHGTGGEHTHEGVDGHTWMDPGLARLQVAALRDALVRAWPGHEQGLAARATELDAEVAALGARLDALRPKWQAARVFSNHPAYGYLARRMGSPVTDLGLDPGQLSLSDAELARIASIASERGGSGAAVVLWESEPSPELARQLETRLRLRAVVFSPGEGMADGEGTRERVGAADDADRADFVGVMRANLARLEAALEG